MRMKVRQMPSSVLGVGLMGLLACGAEAPVAADGGPALRVWLDEVGSGAGILVVQAELDQGLDGLDVPRPQSERLSFELAGPPAMELLGERSVITWRWKLSGQQGSHEIAALELALGEGDDATTLRSAPLWVDLGVEPPRPGELADIVEPEPVIPIPWTLLMIGAGLGGLFFGGIWLAFRATSRGEPPELPPEPPDVAALQRWEAIRRDPTLDDMARAHALSQIFRTYVEAVLTFPATAWTTSEILERLRDMAHLPTGNVPRARRLLRATDRVKYAEARPGQDLLEELDADLRAFVGSTRPHSWNGEER